MYIQKVGLPVNMLVGYSVKVSDVLFLFCSVCYSVELRKLPLGEWWEGGGANQLFIYFFFFLR